MKLNKAKAFEAPIQMRNRFERLRKDTPHPGRSKEATPPAQAKPKRIRHIVAKFKMVETSFINDVRAPTSCLVSFEYRQGG